MHLGRLRLWTAGLLDGWKHGELAEQRQQVLLGGASVQSKREFNEKERAFMLELARGAVASAAFNAASPRPQNVPSCLLARRACFVTLSCGSKLRGCVGQLMAQDPLYQGIINNALSAALRDPRFPPVQAEELSGLQVEISVLSELRRLRFDSPEELLSRLQPHLDGVVLQVGDRFATFLPQVWANVPGKSDFLERLSEKAGCSRGAWRAPDARILVYHVESFHSCPN